MTAVWTGGYVRDTLGVAVHTDPARSIVPVEDLVGIGLRRNPRRAHLLVSTVLAKHVPTPPGLVIAAGELLGVLVGERLRDEAKGDATPAANGPGPGIGPGLVTQLGGMLADVLAAPADSRGVLTELRERLGALRSSHPDVVTVGYAETATGLGQQVADTIGSYYLHSTRHAPEGAEPFAGFEEEHSHATDHQLLPTDRDWLKPDGTVVLVDDEISTGTTILNTIAAVQQRSPQARWVVAALIDLRSAADRGRFDALAAKLGITISVVSLGSGTIDLPPGILNTAQALVETLPGPGSPHGGAFDDDPPGGRLGSVAWVDASASAGPARSARFGSRGMDYRTTAERIAAVVRDALLATSPFALPDVHAPTAADGFGGTSVLVLGSEEFIALPVAVADALGDDLSNGVTEDRGGAGITVRFSTTTRSPIAPLGRDDYAIASAISFRSHDITTDGFGDRFAYNLTRAGRRFDAIVFMPEPGTDPALLTGAGGVTEALRRVTDRVLVVGLNAAKPTVSSPAASPASASSRPTDRTPTV